MAWLWASVAAVLFALVFPSYASAEAERRIVTIENADYFGFDLETVRDVTLADCSQICLAQEDCRAFTYNNNANWCFLKSGYGELRTFVGAVAGRVVEGPAQREVMPRPDLSFLPDWVREESERYLGEIRSGTRGEEYAAALLAQGEGALAAGDGRRATEFLRQALARDPANGAAWSQLARALMESEPDEQTDSYQLQTQVAPPMAR